MKQLHKEKWGQMEHRKTIVDDLKDVEKNILEKNVKVSENLKKCFLAATKDIDGYKAFKYLKKICLWDEVSERTNMESELYKKARRDIWLLIREYIPPNTLAKLEIYDKKDIFEELAI